jgi:hypothetical protein
MFRHFSRLPNLYIYSIFLATNEKRTAVQIAILFPPFHRNLVICSLHGQDRLGNIPIARIVAFERDIAGGGFLFPGEPIHVVRCAAAVAPDAEMVDPLDFPDLVGDQGIFEQKILSDRIVVGPIDPGSPSPASRDGKAEKACKP